MPETTTTHLENTINQSNRYTTDLIKWINIENQLMSNTTEALKEYVKSYTLAVILMAEHYSKIIKISNSSLSKSIKFYLECEVD